MVSFSSSAFIRFNFTASYDKATIEAALLAAAYQATGTATGAALNLARTQLLTAAAGYRFGKTVVILVRQEFDSKWLNCFIVCHN